MVNKKILVSGCSYSIDDGVDYGSILKNHYNMDVEVIAVAGQSNVSITKKIYDDINIHKRKDTLFICQLTYTHRWGTYHSSYNCWLDYQPNIINHIIHNISIDNVIKYDKDDIMVTSGYDVPIKNIDIHDKEYKELSKMYETYLMYVYDDEEHFKHLLYNVDTLKSYVESTGNKIIFLYWPYIKNDKELVKRNFFNVDNEYSMLTWSIKNKLTYHDMHLNNNGHIVLGGILHDYILKNNII
jgi:hypothetical protein